MTLANVSFFPDLDQTLKKIVTRWTSTSLLLFGCVLYPRNLAAEKD